MSSRLSFALTSLVFLAALAVAFVFLLRPADAATFTVDDTADVVDAVPGNGLCATAGDACTLRAAIQEANALGGWDIITLPADTYTLALAGADENASATGDLDITGDLTINGAGAAATIIDGGDLDRVFDVVSGTVSISGVTIRNGSPGAFGGGILNAAGTLTLTNSTVSGNTASVAGGGIANSGILTLTNSTASGNTAGGSGGGGIVNAGTLTLTNSTVSGNTAAEGGGIYNASTLTLTNSTVSGNTAAEGGGGIDNITGTASLSNVTITNNTADSDANGTGSGGGIARAGGTVNLKNTIVAGNADLSSVTVEPDCFGALTSQGYNLIQTVSPGCSISGDTTGNITGQGANLGPLANNGGPTQTHAILAGSPAIDAGSPDCPPPAGDQRGVARPQSSACDIGAYESPATPIGQTLIWGDADCNGSVAPRDSQAGLKHFLSQAELSQTPPCPAIGSSITFDGVSYLWGDNDCNGAVAPRDGQAGLKHFLSQAELSQTPPCPVLGTTGQVSP